MSSDTASSTARGDDAVQINARWLSERRHNPDDVDRTGLVASICAALGGGPRAVLHVAVAAAAFGGAYATTGQTLNGLVAELDLLEGIWLDHIFDREASGESAAVAARDSRTSARRLHELVTTARRSAIVAFAHVSASATKKRIRLARHDIANAIGAVRNAVVLMDEATEGTDVTREHLRGIAKRNSFSVDALVRLHLSDSSVLTPAIGWQDVALSELAETATNELHGATNVGALDAIVGILRAAYDDADMPTTERVTISVVANGPGGGLLTVHAPTHSDRGDDPHAMDAMRQLSAAFGLALEEGSSLAQLRMTFSLSAGDQRHDLSGASQGHHTDAVRF